jgi:hypothetical protein
MARRANVFPSYLLHKQSGQARVRIGGRDSAHDTRHTSHFCNTPVFTAEWTARLTETLVTELHRMEPSR